MINISNEKQTNNVYILQAIHHDFVYPFQYVLRHNADVILETVDPDGNVFNIRSTGDYNVIPVQQEEELSDSDEERDGKVGRGCVCVCE